MQEMKDFVFTKMKSHDSFFMAIDNTPLKVATKLRILQVCGTGRPIFLLRTHPHDATAKAARYFDERVTASLRKMLGPDVDLDDIAQLPVSMGGLGLRAMATIAPFAYEAREKGEQRRVTADIDVVLRDSVSQSMTDQQRDVWRSYAKVDLRLTTSHNDAFVTMCRDRLGLPTTFAHERCTCGQLLDTAHVHCCPQLGAAKIARHDELNKVLAAFAQRRNGVRVEPSRTIQSNRSRPDIQVLTQSGDIFTDVTVTYVGRGPGAMEQRAREKTRKYSPLVTTEGDTFLPFVIGHTGELHVDAEKFLALILPSRAERDEARRELRRVLYEQHLRLYRAARV
jgi:hypothetical protein